MVGLDRSRYVLLTDEICTEEHEGVGWSRDVALGETLTGWESSPGGRCGGGFGRGEEGCGRRWRVGIAIDVVVDLDEGAGGNVGGETQSSGGDGGDGDAIVAWLYLGQH